MLDPLPRNMAVFGDGPFKKTIKIKLSYKGRVLIQYDQFLPKIIGKDSREACTQGKVFVRTQEAVDKPRRLGSGKTLPSPCSPIFSLQKCEKITFCCLVHSLLKDVQNN